MYDLTLQHLNLFMEIFLLLHHRHIVFKQFLNELVLSIALVLIPLIIINVLPARVGT